MGEKDIENSEDSIQADDDRKKEASAFVRQAVHFQRFWVEYGANITALTIFFIFLFGFLKIYAYIQRPAQGVCIFDMEALINKDDYSKFQYAHEAQRRCMRAGHYIGVVNKGSDKGYGYDSKFMAAHFPDIWTPRRIESLAFQIHDKMILDKSLPLITSYYEMQHKCTMVISPHFEDEVKILRLGMVFSSVDGKTKNGITEKNMDKALAALDRSCIGPPPSEKLCSDVPPDSQYTCERQKAWGKCKADWMKPYCCATCHGCSTCSKKQVKEKVPDVKLHVNAR
jgi:hypothetical protein